MPDKVDADLHTGLRAIGGVDYSQKPPEGAEDFSPWRKPWGKKGGTKASSPGGA
jgi:hypothetical protein